MNQKTRQINGITWIDIHNPDEGSRQMLQKRYGFHPLDLTDCESDVQIPKVDVYPKYLFFVFHFPSGHKRENELLEERELDVFIGPDFLITVHKDEFDGMDGLYNSIKKELEEDSNPIKHTSGYLLYRLIKMYFDEAFNILDALGKEISTLEKEIYENQTRDVVEDIAHIRRDVHALRRIMEPQLLLIQQTMKIDMAFIPRALNKYFDDVNDHIKKIWGLIENYHSLVDGLNDTHEALTSHRAAIFFKVLTIFSAIMLPPTLISGIFGMNLTSLPWRDHPYGLVIVLGIMVLESLVMILIFRRKRWL